jgi:hypothetical protein
LLKESFSAAKTPAKAIPSPFKQQRKNANDGLFEKTAADYVKVIMVYCPLWISGCRLTCRFKMAGRVVLN